MARILAVGIAVLDIVNSVTSYPREDDEVRAVEQRITRGGNATNTLVVLSQLGHRCSWAGVLGADVNAKVIDDELARFDIDRRYVRIASGGRTPISCITASRATGSRTIVHYRQLPEFGAADFEPIDLEQFDWLHFEGRNVTETLTMAQRARELRPELPLSIEIEKPRPDIESLFSHADVLFFSRPYVLTRSGDPETFLADLHHRLPHAELVCTWGTAGAWALDKTGRIVHCPARPPARVVDTVGAGDTFIAAYIDARVRILALPDSLEWACRIAGQKCGHAGLDFLTSLP